ncbi:MULTISPECIES: SGNH/GDSL hydrolase family protein [Brevibacterium]|uniref:Lysophospholipase L1 n=1 Tax=Brevibacterium antiquum CNRZ 918 TaxID=1255637 RepID=A0A2H1L0P4_9MICO|nr:MULTISPECIES: SGNH/GDSL hydrolase family protein [Brevibacterium]SMY05032.1 Lysophospholipase L1 [Brevibacterium antiquum CNRZ 918]
MSSDPSSPLRYVAIGDSLSEGVGDDPWPDGSPRGWTDRLAALLAGHYGQDQPIHYANLAVRGYKAAQIADTQHQSAIAMQPDFVTLTAGMNDILRPRVDFDALRAILVGLVEPFTSAGAQVVVVPIPNIAGVSPAGRLINNRRLRLNAIYQHLVDDYGVMPLTKTTNSVFEDPRAWDEDRLHLATLGHERLACAAAASLGLPIEVDFLGAPQGEAPLRTVRTEATWCWRHVTPWIYRRLRGKSSGDGRVAKRPLLEPVVTGGR